MNTLYMAFILNPDGPPLPMVTIEDNFLVGNTEEEVIVEIKQYYGGVVPSIVKVFKCTEVI